MVCWGLPAGWLIIQLSPSVTAPVGGFGWIVSSSKYLFRWRQVVCHSLTHWRDNESSHPVVVDGNPPLPSLSTSTPTFRTLSINHICLLIINYDPYTSICMSFPTPPHHNHHHRRQEETLRNVICPVVPSDSPTPPSSPLTASDQVEREANAIKWSVVRR